MSRLNVVEKPVIEL
ncbi:unnamed protein product, partial [Rotaria sp. Silwood1]